MVGVNPWKVHDEYIPELPTPKGMDAFRKKHLRKMKRSGFAPSRDGRVSPIQRTACVGT